MSWNRIIGQGRVKSILRRALQTDRVAHAYLFSGPEGVGTDALAIELARALNCSESKEEACEHCPNCRRTAVLQHPNLQFLFALPVGKSEKQGDDPLTSLSQEQVESVREQLRLKAIDPYHRVEIPKATFIKINSIRQLKRTSALSQSEPGRKVFIISAAEQMNNEASNALLKTLEEPLADTVLLLTTSEKERLLPTIVSRCQVFQCDPLAAGEIERALVERDGASAEDAAVVSSIAEGSYSVARELLSDDLVKERASVVEFLRMVVGSQRIRLVSFIEEYSSSKDRPSLERWLKVLQSWLREALILNEGVHASGPPAEKSVVENFVRRFPEADLIAAQGSVERAIVHLRKNVYIPLVLSSLAADLKLSIIHPLSHGV
ncbi:MAG TPA: hypothetical protein VMM57_04495 [Bacteroidota bacterium]|nr:hypothetical protein [Bacteroidota bacterium]